MKPPYTPREFVLAVVLCFLLGAFVALCYHLSEQKRCLSIYEQLLDNNEIIIRPK